MAGQVENKGQQIRDDAAKEQPRKKKRWLRVFLVLFVLFLLFVGAIPTLLSLKPVSDYAVSIANRSLRGELRLEGLSTGWVGKTVLEGVEVFDPARRSVINVKRVEVGSGIFGIRSLLKSFGELKVESPTVHLYLDERNNVSIAEAFEPADGSESDDSAGDPFEIPKGVIKVSDGSVTVSRVNALGQSAGQSESVGVDGEFNVESLDDLKGLFDVRLQGDSRLKGNVAVTGFGGGLDDVSGTIDVATNQPAKLGPLLGVILNRNAMEGEASLVLKASFAPKQWEADLDARVNGFRAKDERGVSGTPLDAAVVGKLTMQDQNVQGDLQLSGTPGNAATKITCDLSSGMADMSTEKLMAAVMGGKGASLPAFDLSMNGRIDLAAFDRAVPGLIPMQAGQSLVAGQLLIDDLVARGGSTPSVKGGIKLDGLAAESSRGRTTISPVTAEVDARIVQDKGLQMDRATIESAAVTIDAKGSVRDLEAVFRSDLALLRSELGQVIDLSGTQLDGNVEGALTLSRMDDERVSTNLSLEASQFRYASGENNLEVPRANIVKRGYVNLSDNSVARIVAEELQADLPGQVRTVAKGWFDVESNTFDSSARFDQLEMGAVARYLSAFGITVLRGYTGSFTGAIAFKRNDASGPFLSSGELKGRQAKRDERPLLPEGSVTWSDMRLQPTGAFTIADAKVRAARTDLDVTAFDIGKKRVWYPVGQVKGTADCAEVFGVLGGIFDRPLARELAGQVVLDAAAKPHDNGMRLTGTARANPLTYDLGEGRVTEPVSVEFDAGLDFRKGRITLDTTRVSTAPAEIDVKGSIDKYTSDLDMALSGRYEITWKPMTAMIHRLSPGIKDLVAFEGKTASDFSLRGPMNRDGVTPGFRQATGKASASWSSAKFAGIAVGSSSLSPRMEDGQIILPKATMEAARGKICVVGTLDFRSGPAVVLIPGKHKLLDGVTMTPELSRELLSRINPIFMEVASAQGLVFLTSQDIVLPLGDAEKSRSGGTGRLELTDSKIEADGLLRELLILGGVTSESGLMTVKIKGLDFHIADGRIHYQDFTLLFPRDFDMKFYGSVGLDSTLDLVVSLPLSRELLERMGVRGAALVQTQNILGKRVDVPIVGTREKPIIDFKNIDLGNLLDNALERTVGESLDGVLDGLFNKKKDKENDDRKKRRRRN